MKMFKKILRLSLLFLLFPVLLFAQPFSGQSPPFGQGPPSDMDPGPPGEPGEEKPELPEREDTERDELDEEKERKIINFTQKPETPHFTELRNEGVAIGRSFRIVNSAVANIPKHAMEKVQGKPFVHSIEEDYKVEIVLDESVEQIQADELQEMGYFGKGISVAVMDTGVDGHEYLEIDYQKDFTGEGVGDFHGHGTHVAGIVGLTHSKYTGVSQGIRLYDLKVLKSDGVGSVSDVLEALEYAVERDVDIVNMSFGAEVDECDGSDVLSRAIDNATNYGTLSVVVAGNSGPGKESITLPGCAKEAVTVGSVDSESSLSSFSSRGPTADGRVKPDLVAPGENITSSFLDDGFRDFSGTSMSAPHVAGAIALLKDAGANNNEAVKLLKDSAKDIGRDENEQGEGEIRVEKALDAMEELDDPEEELTEDEEDEEKEFVGPPSKRGRELAQERIQRAEEKRSQAAERTQEKREDLERVTEGIEEGQRERVVRMAETLENINERLTQRYFKRLETFEVFMGKLQEITERREGLSWEDFEELEKKIDSSWNLAEEQAEKDYYIEVDSPEEIMEEFLRQKERLQEDHQKLQEKIMIRPLQRLREILRGLYDI